MRCTLCPSLIYRKIKIPVGGPEIALTNRSLPVCGKLDMIQAQDLWCFSAARPPKSSEEVKYYISKQPDDIGRNTLKPNYLQQLV